MKRLKLSLILLCILNLVLVQVSLAEEKEEGKQKLFKLDEVVVTATKTPHILKDVPVETVVITKDEIEQSSAQTTSDLLRDTSGIFVRSEDAPGISSWRAKIRGLDFNSGYGLILVNGQRVKGGGMGEYGYGLNQIPLNMIEKIEIVKGPSSVLYGSDALAGVVNIITKPTPDRTIFGLQFAYGTYDTMISSLYWGTKVNSFGVFVNATREKSRMGEYGYRSDRDENYKKDRMDAKFSYEMNDKIRLSLYLAGEDKERKREYLTKDTTRYTDEMKLRVAPELNIKLDDGSTFWARTYYYDWNFKTKEYGIPSGFTPRNGNMYYKEAEARYTKPLWESHLATLGAEYLQEELDYNLAEENIEVLSAYLQDEIGVSFYRPLDIVLGGRVDNHSRYGTEFCPKLSLMWKLTDQTRIRGSIGRGFKSPTIRQLYYKEPFQHGTYWYRSNPDLEAETAWGYSLGLEQEIDKRILFDITLFRNDIKNKVVLVETGEILDGLPVKSYENVAKARTQGVEIGLKAIIVKGLSASLSYTYLDTEDLESHKELTYCPRHNLTGHLVYEYRPWGLTFNISGQYVSKMYTDSTNTKETETYSLFDVKLIKKLTKFASISIEGNNIFNSDYGEPDRDWWGSTWLVRFKMDF